MAAGYKAGAAATGTARALALEDARGARFVFAQTEFRVTQAAADFVSAQIMKAYDIDRPGLMFHWSGIGNRPPEMGDLLAAITDALSDMSPAVVRYVHRGVTVVLEEGEGCLASISPDGNLAFAGCAKDGTAIAGEIRAAFQMVEPAQGLRKRGDTLRAFPVQAVSLGKLVTILALSGEAAMPEGVSQRGLIFAPFSNESAAPPKDARVQAAVQSVIARTR